MVLLNLLYWKFGPVTMNRQLATGWEFATAQMTNRPSKDFSIVIYLEAERVICVVIRAYRLELCR
jgi:hypothetical protein